MNDIKTAIYTVGFAFVAYDVYECLYYPDKDGLITYDPNDTNNLGGHQMLAVGFCDKGLIVVNSWSEDYGKNGVIIIPYEYKPSESWVLLDHIKETEIKEKYGEE
jgi:C1A family cysteine protease